MHEIICPHWKKAIKIDEAGYADILKQVRDSEFEQQFHDRLELAERDKRKALELAEARLVNQVQKAAIPKDLEIQDLKAKLDNIKVAQKLAIFALLSQDPQGSVKVTLNIEAEFPNGAQNHIKRGVAENAKALEFKNATWE